VRLPHCYQPGRQYPIQGLTMPTRQSVGLPQDGFVFACFNNPYKLRPEVFECWLRILENTPGSVLWMASFNDAAQSNLCALARNRGVDTSRLVFAPIVKTEAHVARLHLADLYLDTTPYGAGITAAQTLFSGVPLLTIAGETYVGRMAASMLHALRLDPLIADSLPDYEARALRLAHDSQALRQLRERLRLAKELSPVFDPGKSAENLTQLFLRLVKCKPAPALLKDHSEYA